MLYYNKNKPVFFLIVLINLFCSGTIAQNQKIIFQQNGIIATQSDSTVISGSIVLYDDLSTKWIKTELSKNSIKGDSLRKLLKSFIEESDIFNSSWSNTNIFPYPSQQFHTMLDSIPINLLYKSDFHMVPNTHLFSPFGWRRNRQHKGMDLDLNIGDTLRAAFSGKVRYSQFNKGGYGNLVIIRHFNGLETYYAHQDKLLVKPNDIVLAGDVIGLGGETGRAMGPHLHFEVRYKDVAFNPENIIDFKNDKIKSQNTYYLTKSDFKWVKAVNRKKYYNVKPGDVLGKIATKNKTTVKKILRLNPSITNPNSLKIGQKVRVR
tara:strand:- start:2909 stop:3868 length:960 start_codon:yes stop_codon:yes gene_type:complete